jgi:hypothetical protein
LSESQQVCDDLVAATAPAAAQVAATDAAVTLIAALDAAVAPLEAEVADLTVRLEQAVADLDAKDATIAAQQADIEAKSAALNAAADALDQASAELDAQLAAINDLRATIVAQRAEIATKDATITAQLDKIATQTATISAQVTTINQRDATIAAQNTTIATQTATIAARDTTIAQQSATIAARNATITAQAATIATQAARIAELEDELSGQDASMSVGAIIGSQCHTLSAFISQIGTPGVRRYFNGGGFAPITQNSTIQADLGKWDRLISYKATTVNRTALLACLNSIPKDGKRTVLMCQNEPERSDKTDFATPALWRAYVNDFIEQVVAWCDANGRPDVYPGWSFSYWRPLTDPTISEWWPTCPNRARAVFGCQSYDPNNIKTLEQQTKIPIDRWRAAGGRLWMLSEVATHRTGTDGRDWIINGFNWAANYGCLFAAYYDDVVGKDGPWCVIDSGQNAGLKATMPAIAVTV